MRKISAGRLETIALAAAPALFVFLWSTGWIAARFAAIDCDVLTFLAARFGLAFLVFLAIVVASRAALPVRRRDVMHGVVSGVLLHPLYICCLWWAIEHGVPAGISAVLAAMQPILTALLAPALVGERITAKRWLGIALGFAGIVIVLLPRLQLALGATHDDVAWPLFVNVCGMLSVTAGSFYQKRFLQAGDLRTTAMLQYFGAAVVSAVIAYAFGPLHFTISFVSVATLAWSVLALSVCSILLYLWLIREGAVSRSASLIFLVPAAAAIEAWLLFGETLSPAQIGGILVTIAGVGLATR